MPLSVIPFLLRGVSLLGIDSVLQPFAARQAGLGAAGSRPRPRPARRRWSGPATLAELPALGADILKGRVQGRVVVDVNA